MVNTLYMITIDKNNKEIVINNIFRLPIDIVKNNALQIRRFICTPNMPSLNIKDNMNELIIMINENKNLECRLFIKYNDIIIDNVSIDLFLETLYNIDFKPKN